MLGLLDEKSVAEWKGSLQAEIADYDSLRKEILPDISREQADPLSGEATEKGWNKYYEVLF
jgi:hypothetical protein